MTFPRLFWATDLHLDEVGEEQYCAFVKVLKGAGASHLLITGDIADGATVADRLQRLHRELGIPLYFVLGNHDFFGRTIADVRGEVAAVAPPMVYLTVQEAPVALNDEVAVIGHDGWHDGRLGDWYGSPVRQRWRDYHHIQDLIPLEGECLLERLRFLADEGVDILEERIHRAFGEWDTLLLLTHVPPFRESACYDDAIANDMWAPFSVNAALGEMLIATMRQYPDKQIRVLCGHAHHAADYSPLPNLCVLTGGAEVGSPRLQVVNPVQAVANPADLTH